MMGRSNQSALAVGTTTQSRASVYQNGVNQNLQEQGPSPQGWSCIARAAGSGSGSVQAEIPEKAADLCR